MSPNSHLISYQMLMDNVAKTLQYTIEVEEKIPISEVTNFDEIVGQVQEQLESLRDNPNRMENPMIYHLDVGAMYPNIILTNR